MALAPAQQGARPLELRSETLGRILRLSHSGDTVNAELRTTDRLLVIAIAETARENVDLAGSRLFFVSAAFDVDYAEAAAVQAWLDSLA